jgi:hypothetical protein
MSFEEFFHQVEQQVLDFGKRLWPGSASERQREQAEQLRAELQHHHSRARHHRQAVWDIQARLEDNGVREAMLASQIETFLHTRDQPRAYQLALELDVVRRQLEEDRSRLPYHEQAYRNHRACCAELEQRLRKLNRYQQAQAQSL